MDRVWLRLNDTWAGQIGEEALKLLQIFGYRQVWSDESNDLYMHTDDGNDFFETEDDAEEGWATENMVSMDGYASPVTATHLKTCVSVYKMLILSLF